MAAPTVVQHHNNSNAFETVSVSTTDASLSGATGSFNANATAGNTIVVVICQTVSALRTYVVSDDVDGTYTITHQIDGDAGERQVAFAYKENITGGATTVKIKTTSGSNSIFAKATEISATNGSPVISSIPGTTATIVSNQYPCSASSTIIDTTTAPFGISMVAADANAGGFTAASGWTIVGSGGNQHGAQFISSASAFTDEQGYLTDGGVDRDYAGLIAAFESPAAGGGGFTGGLSLLGVGT